MNKVLFIISIVSLIILNLLLIRRDKKLLSENSKLKNEFTNSLEGAYKNIQYTLNLKLVDQDSIFDKNNNSIAISQLPKSHNYLYVNENQCSTCVYKALENVSKIENEKLSVIIRYEDEAWKNHVIERNLEGKNFYYSKSKFLLNDEDISYPIFFHLNKFMEVKNSFVFSDVNLLSNTYITLNIK